MDGAILAACSTRLSEPELAVDRRVPRNLEDMAGRFGIGVGRVLSLVAWPGRMTENRLDTLEPSSRDVSGASPVLGGLHRKVIAGG